MMRSLWTAASGMRAQQVNVDTIANNIANVNTAGYKSQQASFKSLLYQNLQSKSTNNAGDLKPVAAEVGLGSRVSAITAAFTQGELLASDNPYAMAIEGDGFFQVRSERGEILYTRDGNFAVSPTEDGAMLCTSDGYPVLDQMGNTITIPNSISASNFASDEYGRLGYFDKENNYYPLVNQTADGREYEVQFGLVQFNNPAGLEKVGGNNFAVTIASGDPLAELGNDAIRQSKVHKGYSEGSNVDVANEMVNLIVAQRAYEMNSKAIQATDDMMQQANNLR